MSDDEAVLWALRQNYHLDKSNAAVHCATPRFSPITFALFDALSGPRDDYPTEDHVMLQELRDHQGLYPLDPGR